MNKSIKNMFMIILFTYGLLGCAQEDVKTFPPFDKDKAEDECAVLIIPANIIVHRIDGKTRSRFNSWRANKKAAKLLIPAGERNFIFEYSNLMEGKKIENLKYSIAMDKEKMYMVSVVLDENKTGNIFSSAMNLAASFVRDVIIDNLPFVDLLPRPNRELEGVSYQIIETNQEAFEQYLLESGKKMPNNIFLLSILIGLLWFFIIFAVLRTIMYLWFMGNLKNKYPIAALILTISSVVAGIIIINYNSDGNNFYYLMATLLMGISISYFDMGSTYNKRGLEALEGKSIGHNISVTLDDLIENKSAQKFNNNFEKAVFHFSKAIKSSPYNAAYLNNRGLAYCKMQNWKKAFDDFNKAMQLKPKNEQYKKNYEEVRAAERNSRGLVKFENKDYNDALNDFKWAVHISPNNPVYIFNRGSAYSCMQDWNNAIADFTKALQLDPKNEIYKKNLLNAQTQLKKMSADNPIKIEGVKRVAVIQSQQDYNLFMSDYPKKLESEGYQLADNMGEKSMELYQEFAKLPVDINTGEIYEYTRDPYKLLISRSDLKVMVSFIKK